MNLNKIKYSVFILSDIFNIESTKNGIDKNKIENLNGNYPYITRTDNNNGIDGFIGIQEKYDLNDENVITIGLDTQTVFYQDTKFYTGQNIQILKNDNLNKYNALFIITLLKKLLDKFNWGGNGATLSRLRNSRIILPDKNGVPDYDYMTQYMKNIEKQQISIYENYIESIKHYDIGKVVINSLDDVEWKEFKIKELFNVKGSKTTSLNDLKNKKDKDRLYPYITTKSNNNGIDGFYYYFTENKNVLTVDSATIGSIFYQPDNFSASDHVEILEPKFKMNKYSALFIKTIIAFSIKGKYNYGYKFNQKRIKNQIIKLPINNQGKLDLQFMENYIKKIEQKNI